MKWTNIQSGFFQKEKRIRSFEKERKEKISKAVTLATILCAILVPLFCLLDLIVKQHLFWIFFIIRMVVTLVCIVLYFLSKSSFGKKHPYPIAAFLAIWVCSSIALMCRIDMGPQDPYYAGINLPLLGFGIMLPLTLMEGLFVFILVWCCYFVPNLLILEHQNIGSFISNNFFLISTIIISLAGSRFNFITAINQWRSRRRLQSAHRKIKRHTIELENKIRERTQMLLQSERLAVVGQLAGGVAHDFNNILTGILGISELLLTSTSKKTQIRKDIESIKQIGERGSSLVGQLLTFSRRQLLDPKVVNLNEIIEELEKILSRLIGENIQFNIKTNLNLGNVLADPVQIEQIILNLAVNARDAMSQGGELTIETYNLTINMNYCKKHNLSIPPGTYVIMSIKDTGIGMNSKVKSKIFEPFFTTKAEHEGTGLGLSTVYGIIKQSHGDIIVESKEGQGTEFKIHFPMIKKTYPKSSYLKKPVHKIPRGHETILLVEDEDEVRNLTARLLEQQGYNVLKAREGKEALILASEHKDRIKLLLTDIVMPHMNGPQLAENLVSKQEDLKVLFISGYANNLSKYQFTLNIKSDFLKKPYTFEDLHFTVRNLLDQS